MIERQEFYERMISTVWEEIQAQGMKLVGALLVVIGPVDVSVKQEGSEPMETELSEVCGELLDELSGVRDLIS